MRMQLATRIVMATRATATPDSASPRDAIVQGQTKLSLSARIDALSAPSVAVENSLVVFFTKLGLLALPIQGAKNLADWHGVDDECRDRWVAHVTESPAEVFRLAELSARLMAQIYHQHEPRQLGGEASIV